MVSFHRCEDGIAFKVCVCEIDVHNALSYRIEVKASILCRGRLSMNSSHYIYLAIISDFKSQDHILRKEKREKGNK